MTDTSGRALGRAAERLSRWMHEHSWPLWWNRARLDNGAFREVLDFDGSPIPGDESRVRVQARQLFSFSLARRLGWTTNDFDAGLALSLQRFLDTCLRRDGVAGRRVDTLSGSLIDDTPDLYDNAFCVLALASCRQVLDAAKVEAPTERLLTSIDATLARADGAGFHEVLPPPNTRRQNPHMHFFESLLLLFEATGDASIRERAETLFAFVEARFFDTRQSVVSEEVDDAATPVDEYEPGHSMEWVWLLGYRARLFATRLHEFAPRLYRHYVSAGIDEGRTPMGLRIDNEAADATRRLWSQTESLKAHLCMLELGPESERDAACRRALACAESIERDWLTRVCAGGWRDHFDADDRLIATDMPASSGYHVYLAIAELARVARTMTTR